MELLTDARGHDQTEWSDPQSRLRDMSTVVSPCMNVREVVCNPSCAQFSDNTTDGERDAQPQTCLRGIEPINTLRDRCSSDSEEDATEHVGRAEEAGRYEDAKVSKHNEGSDEVHRLEISVEHFSSGKQGAGEAFGLELTAFNTREEGFAQCEEGEGVERATNDRWDIVAPSPIDVRGDETTLNKWNERRGERRVLVSRGRRSP